MSLHSESWSSESPHGDETQTSRTRWHRVDAVSLVAGLAAIAVALLSLLDIDVDAGVLVPVVLLAAGLAGVVNALRRDRR